MNIRRVITLWVIAILFGLSRPDIAFGQTPTPRVPASLTAHIPFDFWIGGTRLPAGDYSISPGVPSVVVFWNEAGHVGEQVFLVSTGASVASGSCKLIFALHDGKHHLRAIWYSEGEAVLTSEFNLPLGAGDTETEVKLMKQNHDGERVRARQ